MCATLFGLTLWHGSMRVFYVHMCRVVESLSGFHAAFMAKYGSAPAGPEANGH